MKLVQGKAINNPQSTARSFTVVAICSARTILLGRSNHWTGKSWNAMAHHNPNSVLIVTNVQRLETEIIGNRIR
jgi:hypothetical protein